MTPISVVIWDVGGTLVDHAMSREAFLRSCLHPAGITLESLRPEDIRDATATRRSLEMSWRTLADEREGFIEVATTLLRSVEVTLKQVGLVADAMSRYFDLYSPVPGIYNLLSDLRNADTVQAVVSNWPPSLHTFLEYHELVHFFEVVVGSSEFGRAKPDPEIFQRALDDLGVTPEHCVYVGDHPDNDIRPAQALGMRTIHFNPRGNYAAADERDVDGLRRRLLQMLGGVKRTGVTGKADYC